MTPCHALFVSFDDRDKNEFMGHTIHYIYSPLQKKKKEKRKKKKERPKEKKARLNAKKVEPTQLTHGRYSTWFISQLFPASQVLSMP